jgi:hypothetical protein
MIPRDEMDQQEDHGKDREAPERPVFAHQPWMVGVVLVFAVVAILAGLVNPVWFLVGAPCILVLAVYIYVRIASRGRAEE